MDRRYKKILLAFLLSVFTGATLLADSALAVDARCWTKSACIRARTDRGVPAQEATAGFYEGTDAKAVCGETVRLGIKDEPAGFCLPAGKTVTQISFGGTTSFAHIGDFIKFMYRYGFQIAITLAVVVIVFAGFQWTMSRGSPDGIKKAQDHIYKAILGIILFSISYTILNFLSPSFVNIRLPQVWMINPVHLTSQYCTLVDSTVPLAKLAENDEARVMPEAEKKKKYAEITSGVASSGGGFSVTPQKAQCGNTFLLSGGNGTSCEGLACEGTGKVCYQRLGNPRETCEWANVGGHIYNSNIDAVAGGVNELIGAWDWKWANEPILYFVCSDGEYHEVSGGQKNDPDNDNPDETRKILQYQIRALSQSNIDAATAKCGSADKLRGFVLTLDMREAGEPIGFDERHFIGILRQTYSGIDLGDKSNFDADCILRKAPPDMFITPEEVVNGIRLDVDVNLIKDIDDESDRIREYAQFDYQSC